MSKRTHGKSDTPEFRVWTGMQTRCYNPRNRAYASYGARGITICERWRASFENFLTDIGPRPSSSHSIERVDNDGNYAPENCKWATREEQGRNKRNNVKVFVDGIEKTLSEWCRIFDVELGTASLRHKNGVRGVAVFATTVQQITFGEVTDTLAGWSARTGIKTTTIGMRINQYHWPVQRALTEGARQ